MDDPSHAGPGAPPAPCPPSQPSLPPLMDVGCATDPASLRAGTRDEARTTRGVFLRCTPGRGPATFGPFDPDQLARQIIEAPLDQALIEPCSKRPITAVLVDGRALPPREWAEQTLEAAYIAARSLP